MRNVANRLRCLSRIGVDPHAQPERKGCVPNSPDCSATQDGNDLTEKCPSTRNSILAPERPTYPEGGPLVVTALFMVYNTIYATHPHR